MDADLGAGHDAEPIFEADLRTRVEAEEVAGEIAEVAGAERAVNRCVTRNALANRGIFSVVGRPMMVKSGCDGSTRRSLGAQRGLSRLPVPAPPPAPGRGSRCGGERASWRSGIRVIAAVRRFVVIVISLRRSRSIGRQFRCLLR